MTKRTLSGEQLDAMLARGHLLDGPRDAPRLLIIDSVVIKFFPAPRPLSTSTVYPKYQRFIRNSVRLGKLGIRAPRVTELLVCPSRQLHAVSYAHLPGKTIRELCEAGEVDALTPVTELLSDLHRRGIYFRAIHLGNLLLEPGCDMALLDIADLSIWPWSLTPFQRARNLAHLFAASADTSFHLQFGIRRFLESYYQQAALTTLEIRLLEWRIRAALSNSRDGEVLCDLQR